MFEQHTFAGTAFADDGCDLALKNFQADAPQHRIGIETFIYIVKLDEGSFHMPNYFRSLTGMIQSPDSGLRLNFKL